MNANKDQEITELKAQYELDIYNLNNQMNNLTSQLLQYLGEEDTFVGTWARYLGNESIFFDTIYIYSNKTARLEYAESGTVLATYTFENGILSFDMGTVGRDFSYCFLDENTLVVSNPYQDWSVDPKAIYIKS